MQDQRPPVPEKDNIIDYISRVSLQSGVNKQTGRPYFYSDVYFSNGFQKRIFYRSDEVFAIKDALAQNPLDNNPLGSVPVDAD